MRNEMARPHPAQARKEIRQPEGLAPAPLKCPSPWVTQAFASRQGNCVIENICRRAQNCPADLRREQTSALETGGKEGATALVLPELGDGAPEEEAQHWWKAPGKDQPRENEASAFPRYRSGTLPGWPGCESATAFWELPGQPPSHPPGPQPAEQAKEMGGGGWAKCWSRLTLPVNC